MSADLFVAVASGNAERVRELLASNPGAAQIKDEEGATALHYATLNGHRTIAQALLEQGADVNARDERFGATPAGWAIEYLREAGGLLAIEIDDVLFAIRQKDVPWVRRFLTRLPALAQQAMPTGNLYRNTQPSQGTTRLSTCLRRHLGYDSDPASLLAVSVTRSMKN